MLSLTDYHITNVQNSVNVRYDFKTWEDEDLYLYFLHFEMIFRLYSQQFEFILKLQKKEARIFRPLIVFNTNHSVEL